MYLYLTVAILSLIFTSCDSEEKLKRDIKVISHDIEELADDIDDTLYNVEN